ncbi:MAG: hypothetical protein KME30_29445 [Iphinoe sp. HA4291-MV1]|nr:hypothetical protein [Iphinoe sp. HA4291-MV1]
MGKGQGASSQGASSQGAREGQARNGQARNGEQRKKYFHALVVPEPSVRVCLENGQGDAPPLNSKFKKRILNAHCPMPNAQFPMPHAQFPIPNGYSVNHQSPIPCKLEP